MSDVHLEVARWVAQTAPALLVGSVALRLAHGGTQTPNDIDFFVAARSLSPIAAALAARGYGWTSWEREVFPPFDEGAIESLRGRIYLRGRHASLPIVDLTYEPPMPFEDAWARRDEVDGLQVASAQDLAQIMLARGNAQDLAWAERLRRAQVSLP